MQGFPVLTMSPPDGKQWCSFNRPRPDHLGPRRRPAVAQQAGIRAAQETKLFKEAARNELRARALEAPLEVQPEHAMDVENKATS